MLAVFWADSRSNAIFLSPIVFSFLCNDSISFWSFSILLHRLSISSSYSRNDSTMVDISSLLDDGVGGFIGCGVVRPLKVFSRLIGTFIGACNGTCISGQADSDASNDDVFDWVS